MRILAVALVVALILACAPPKLRYRHSPLDPSDTLPPWPYHDIVEGVLGASRDWEPSDVKHVELLAWYGKVDSRPWYVNVALCWVELEDRWALVQLAQNPVPPDEKPKHREFHSRWHAYYIYDIKWRPVAIFDRPPTASDVEHFLTEWDDSGRGWKYLTRGVRTQTLKRLLGEEPQPLAAWRDAG